MPPNVNPIKRTSQLIIFKFSDSIIAGFNKEKNEAEIITPADTPSIASNTFLFTFLKKKTIDDPKVVIKKVKKVAKNVNKIIL